MHNLIEELPQTQRELFPIVPFIVARDQDAAKVDKRPAPIQTADKFNFPLQHYAPLKKGQEYQYSIIDWIAGLTGDDNRKATKLWANMQNELSISTGQLPYEASNGKTYQMDFTNAKGLYLISQSLRATKARPQLKEIREFLASSAAWVELIARDQDAAASAAKAIARHHGLRADGITKRKIFTKTLQDTHASHNPEYWTATNVIYHKLFRTVTEKTAKTEVIAILNLDGKQAKNLRDHVNGLALSAIAMAEEASAAKMEGLHRPLSTYEQIEIIRYCAREVAVTANRLAEFAGVDLVTGQSLLRGQN